MSSWFESYGLSDASPMLQAAITDVPVPSVSTGSIAAILTAACWAVGAIAFAASGRMIGSKYVNRIRLVLAALLVGGAILMAPWLNQVFPSFVPADLTFGVPPAQLILLALSGFLGLVFGDACYFESLVVLGARRAALLTMLTPIFVALLIVPILNESLTLAELIGMFLTLGGVAWVILERTASKDEPTSRLWHGILLGALGCVGQASGFLVAKAGLGSANPDSLIVAMADLPKAVTVEGVTRAGVEVNALVGTFYRMGIAALILWAWSAMRGDLKNVVGAMRNGRAMGILGFGTIIGPALGVTLAMYALSHSNTAIASTIIATMPIMVIPMVIVIHRERVSWRAFLGSLVALAGVAILMGLDREIGLRSAIFGE